MFNSLEGGNTSLAASYRMKLSSIALIVFIIIAAICFYLKLSGVITDLIYYAILFGLIVAALVLTLVLGRISKKRYSFKRLTKKVKVYFLFAFLAQASLQYFCLASKVINVCLQTGHFLFKHSTFLLSFGLIV